MIKKNLRIGIIKHVLLINKKILLNILDTFHKKIMKRKLKITRLKHTQLNVCEKEELSCTWYKSLMYSVHKRSRQTTFLYEVGKIESKNHPPILLRATLFNLTWNHLSLVLSNNMVITDLSLFILRLSCQQSKKEETKSKNQSFLMYVHIQSREHFKS